MPAPCSVFGADFFVLGGSIDMSLCSKPTSTADGRSAFDVFGREGRHVFRCRTEAQAARLIEMLQAGTITEETVRRTFLEAMHSAHTPIGDDNIQRAARRKIGDEDALTALFNELMTRCGMGRT
jgi:hypothetical protein